jgi:hypothetical protein
MVAVVLLFSHNREFRLPTALPNREDGSLTALYFEGKLPRTGTADSCTALLLPSWNGKLRNDRDLGINREGASTLWGK